MGDNNRELVALCARTESTAQQVEMLLARGADADIRNPVRLRPGPATPQSGCSALWLACRSGNEAVARLLIQRGAQIDARDDEVRRTGAPSPQNGQTPLHVASEHGNAAVARLLLECRASVDAKNTVRV